VADLLGVRWVPDHLAGQEQRGHLAVLDHRVDADLLAGHALLDQHRMVAGVQHRVRRLGVAGEREHPAQVDRRIHPDDAEARTEPARFQDRRVPHLLRREQCLAERLHRYRLRLRHTGLGERCPGLRLVPQPPDHRRVAVAQPERLGDVRGGVYAAFVPAQHAGDRLGLP
jgi:hypothetical protein